MIGKEKQANAMRDTAPAVRRRLAVGGDMCVKRGISAK